MPKEDKKALIIILPLFFGGLSLWLWAKKQAIIYGLVTDGDTGIGIAGIVVGCNGYEQTLGAYLGMTDATGHYKITVDAGTYRLSFIDPEGHYNSSFGDITIGRAQQVEVNVQLFYTPS